MGVTAYGPWMMWLAPLRRCTLSLAVFWACSPAASAPLLCRNCNLPILADEHGSLQRLIHASISVCNQLLKFHWQPNVLPFEISCVSWGTTGLVHDTTSFFLRFHHGPVGVWQNGTYHAAEAARHT